MKTKHLSNKVQSFKSVVLSLTLLVGSTCMIKAETSLFRNAGINKVLADTSSLPIQDSISAACPNLPDVVRHKSGRPFFGLNQQYDTASIADIGDWLHDYPKEVAEYYRLAEHFVEDTDITTLTYTQKLIYNDIFTVWIYIRHESTHSH